MSNLALLIFGAVVSFTTLAGCYLYVVESLWEADEPRESTPTTPDSSAAGGSADKPVGTPVGSAI
jgi:hypothetical protein